MASIVIDSDYFKRWEVVKIGDAETTIVKVNKDYCGGVKCTIAPVKFTKYKLINKIIKLYWIIRTL